MLPEMGWRTSRGSWLTVGLGLGLPSGCGDGTGRATAGDGSTAADGAGTSSSVGSGVVTDEGSTSDPASSGPGDDGVDTSASTTGEPSPDAWSATLVDRAFLCKVISDASLEDPTDNATHTRFNLMGTDLGVPVVVGDTLHLFFGDTVGWREIWDFGEDPDAVASIALADVQADPTALCRDLEFAVTADVPSVAADTEPSIERDFAGAWMNPPPGHDIAEFIAQPAGPFANMPGTFEVPAGGLADGDAAILFYAGRVELDPTRATIGMLARWGTPGAGLPIYDVVREVDALVDGTLGGHFIQIAPVERDGVVSLFGTGDYRKSGVYLARVELATLDTGAGTELWDPGLATWHVAESLGQPEREAIEPVFEGHDGVGELSITRLDDPDVLVALYQRELHDAGGAIVDNRVVLRVATAPEGPWSDALTIVDMADPAFSAEHCCGATCPGAQVLHCESAGLYGAYLVPAVSVVELPGGARELELPFLVSTWNPYNVVLFTTTVRLDPA